MGIVTGLLAAGFILAVQLTARTTIGWRPLHAFVLAGLVTGLLAQWTPEIMGLSYDALSRIFRDELELQSLLMVLLAKLVATACSIGLRLPGGLIGPSLVMGGCVGGFTELVLSGWQSLETGSTGLYAIIGMVAMMGAVLRAPLAALVALMELTGNLNIILPGMIAVVSGEITTRALIGDASAFTALLKVQHAREATRQRPAEDRPAPASGSDKADGT
jgi:H+/Cl- antiporter ClcA